MELKENKKVSTAPLLQTENQSVKGAMPTVLTNKKIPPNSNTIQKESPAIERELSSNNNVPQKLTVVNSNNMQEYKKRD